MILEMRTTRYVPGSAARLNPSFERALQARQEISPLAGLFHVDAGVLNTTIELWPYRDREERALLLARAEPDGDWPAELADVRVEQHSVVLDPAPCNGPLVPARLGGLYEFRIYQVVPGKMHEAIANFEEKVTARAELSPFVGLFSSQEPEPLFVHIWAYTDASERARVRAQAQAEGLWPPRLASAGLLVRQESVLAVPAPFSPLS